jgi:hypothetical protein
MLGWRDSIDGGQMTNQEREALVRVAASLAATISILERTPQAKKAAPSNAMFEMMMDDYRRALEFGREVLALSSTPRGGEA